MDQAHDDEIVRRVLAGDEDAYEVIVTRYQRVLWKLAAFHLTNRLQIAEVVDASFVKAYFALERYESGRDFGAWLKAIARNEVKMELRNILTEKMARAGYAERLAAEAALSEIDRDRQELLAEYLEGCLEMLSPEQRELLNMRYGADKSVAQMAGELGKGVEALKKSLSRVRAQLRLCVQKKAVHHGA